MGLVALMCGSWAWAQSEPSPASPPAGPGPQSSLDAVLFYQVLIGEMQWQAGEPGAAYSIVLDAARRSRDEALFRRAVDIALQARAGDEALAATRAWRQALPQSVEALRSQIPIMAALNRLQDVAEPLGALLKLTPAVERGGLIASVPRLFQRAPDQKAMAELLEGVLRPYLTSQDTAAAAYTAVGRQWLAAGQVERSLASARTALTRDPAALGGPLLALELMPRAPDAEALVKTYLARPAEPLSLLPVRLAYGRVLAQAQRHADAIEQLSQVTQLQPALAPPWLTLGALHLELRNPAAAETALQRYVQLASQGPPASPPQGRSEASPAETASDPDESAPGADSGLTQAWILLAQAAELRNDFAGAESYLARIDNPQRALDVQTRRAIILARQGQLEAALGLVRRIPEREEDDARAKVLAEVQVLREVKRWREAYATLGEATQRWPKDTELVYEQAMMAEKLDRLDDMERLLRRVIAEKPDHQHAYNALGYSLADRGVRLVEARELIRKALSMAPGDPFITDSLGWVEFRSGNLAEAERLLRQAYQARPDTEIAAHLGEVLWVQGNRDEARRIFREGRTRDATNEVLRETLTRLRADP